MDDIDIKTILFVDDEQPILRALKRLFIRSKHQILVAQGGQEALDILSSQTVDMLITDMRMPEMDGYQLLLEVKGRFPEVIRIALSGYTDKKVVLSALDKNLAKIYLFKPWNNDEIIQTIEGLFVVEAMLNDKNLLSVINNFDQLPTLPQLYLKISEMIKDQDSISDITSCIEDDQAIASRILRIANSAFYGSKTGSIKDAIMFIGLDNVKSIILNNTVFSASYGDAKAMEHIWHHSSETNKLLNLIYSKLLNKRLSKEEKSAGLLHNIGEGVIITNRTTKSKDEVNDQLNGMGVGHEMIGSYLLNWWELPLPIIESAMFHHQPNHKLIINKGLVAAVHIAQYYAWKICGCTVDEELSACALQQLGLSIEGLEKLINDYF